MWKDSSQKRDCGYFSGRNGPQMGFQLRTYVSGTVIVDAPVLDS